MSQQENTQKKHGGRRANSGRKAEGRTKQIRSVTVDDYVWLTALDIWSGKASRLIERLLSRYVQTPSIIPSNGNATS